MNNPNENQKSEFIDQANDLLRQLKAFIQNKEAGDDKDIHHLVELYQNEEIQDLDRVVVLFGGIAGFYDSDRYDQFLSQWNAVKSKIEDVNALIQRWIEVDELCKHLSGPKPVRLPPNSELLKEFDRLRRTGELPSSKKRNEWLHEEKDITKENIRRGTQATLDKLNALAVFVEHWASYSTTTDTIKSESTADSGDEQWYAGSYYEDQTNGLLKNKTLNKAYHDKRLISEKRNGNRRYYPLKDILENWPEYTEMLPPLESSSE